MDLQIRTLFIAKDSINRITIKEVHFPKNGTIKT